jgi:hypothetical protein
MVLNLLAKSLAALICGSCSTATTVREGILPSYSGSCGWSIFAYCKRLAATFPKSKSP